ncbi:MAG: CPBP family intramembrane metalloprotease [Candidatus Margulisbacteria bacterium]|nr:CPBP family intramembrane metalloprotease [Bacilli bacterium]MDD4528191.1 CPBP family intramembrane metalloprotease [Candidatus Margulisiibacteriota bacterium]
MKIVVFAFIIFLTFLFVILLTFANIIWKNKYGTKLRLFVSYIWFLLVISLGIIWSKKKIISIPTKPISILDTFLFLLLITPFIFYSGYKIKKDIKNVLPFCLIFPIGEEIMFRGIILNLLPIAIGTSDIMIPFPLLKEVTLQVLISAFLFGIMHLQYFKFRISKDTMIKILFAFIFGIFMGNLVELTNSLLYPIIFHIIANAGATVYFIRNSNKQIAN